MKTEKLTLKHLAPYLPYELKIITKKHLLKYGETHQLIMNGLSIDIKGNLDIEMCKSKTDTELWFKNEFKDGCFKPILRPLSDLTKEIDCIDGRLIPLDYLWFNIIGTDSDCFERDEIEILIEYDTTLAPFKIVQKLFEWHFDVFNLIPDGLAIDINTLKK